MTGPSGVPPSQLVTPGQQKLVDLKRVAVVNLGRPRVISLWGSARTLIEDARTTTVSNLSRLNMAYDAAQTACQAVLASYNLKPQSGLGQIGRAHV